jgi:drug/metabolite transporter (DMT)-like permease
MYTYFQPITAALLAAIMGLAEFGIVKILATLLIFVGVWFVTRSKGTDPTPMKKE